MTPISQNLSRSSTLRKGPCLLSVKNLAVSYGKAQVIHDVSFEVHAGEFAVMLGRNGAGKSTILRAISSLIPKRGGTVAFRDEEITHSNSVQVNAAGLIHVLEGHRIFPSLTVEENLVIGTWNTKFRGSRNKLSRIYDLFPELAQRRHQLAARLSGGQQQILAVGAGVIAEPRLLILDEPSGGLAPLVIIRILEAVAELCRGGMAVFLVEQMVETALRFSDYVYLIENGRISGEGTEDVIKASDALKSVYLGH
jgi:branched-chain amino acid transport system ATP-binding protein